MTDADTRSRSRADSVHSQSSQGSAYIGAARSGRLPSGIKQSTVSMFTGTGARTPGGINYGDNSIASPSAIDRVFPVRSAVSIDPNVAQSPRNEPTDIYKVIHIGGEGTIAARRAAAGGGDDTSPTHLTDGEQLPTADSPRMGQKSASTARSDNGDGPKDVARRPSTFSYQGSVSSNTNNKLDHRTLPKILNDDDGGSIKSGKSARSEANSINSNNPSSLTGSAMGDIVDDPPLVTARFKHVVTDGGHAVITGRGGETLQRCEDEPIHIPGAIQSFGMLLAFREENGKLVVHVVSENSLDIIGYAPQALFRLDNLVDIFSDEQADNLLDHLDFIRDEDASDVVANGPEVFMISIRPPHHRTRKLWCAMHACALDKETIICEFEVEDDKVNPLVPNDEMTPEPPEDTLGCEPTAEELAESTVNISKPLRVLRSARKKRGEAAAMEVFNIMSQVQEQLASAPSLPVFLRVLIGVVKELTGFHRVMIYQFDQTWNGRVVAELVDPRATKDLYKGLNFPASDIPRQARDMYKLNKVRLLYDRSQETARLVCRTVEDLEKPLDLTHAYLRAMSPIHIKYLANMAVRSSMSISINAFNELWGLIACHTYGSKGVRVSFPIRKMCRLVGDTASRNIERLSYASRLQARKLINTSSSTRNPSGYIVASSEDLLQLFDADVGALSIRDETKVMGNSAGHLQEILAMVEFLRLKRMNSVYTSQDINMDFPDLRYGPGLKFLAGVLYVPLSTGGNDFIAFFRKGVYQEVKWAGNPYEKFIKEGTEGYLEPRKSFKQWSEMIVGRCRDWTEEEIETASVLCLVYGKFIDVWRQKEAALQSSQLTKLLLANSAHEVRTPLNAIINYLEIALEGSLDQEVRDNLSRSHSASKSLVYVINDLLDLTKTEENKELIKEEIFDLHHTLREATDPFVGDAKRKGIEYAVDIDANIPQEVLGDHRRVRQIVSNLIANAVQHTTQGEVKVGAWKVNDQSVAEKCEIEISVEDTGSGMCQEKVDALFQELEEVSYEGASAAQQLLEPIGAQEKSDSTGALGLGLAVVARTVRNMNGQLRLKTEEGKGSKFIIALCFTLSKRVEEVKTDDRKSVTSPNAGKQTPLTDGEVTLVKRSSSVDKKPIVSPPVMTRQASADSMQSLNSLASMKSGKSGASGHSNRSDADRLIDALQEPLRISSSSEPGSYNDESRVNRTIGAGQTASPQKHRNVGSANGLKSARKIPGQQSVRDSGTPLRPVRVPDVQDNGHEQEREDRVHRATVEEISTPAIERPSADQSDTTSDRAFSVLVAEDDPINSKIMKKRLEKLGHKATMTVNGEECSSLHGERPADFDAVLMDLQMPIVDGFSSTKMIRSFEKTQSTTSLSARAKHNGRIPIFAVSASLVESERQKYIDTGFDGWILKPVDFQKVDKMLKGIVDEGVRNECLYRNGKWEQGGWFRKREARDKYFETDTNPSQEKPTAEAEKMIEEEWQSDRVATDGSLTPTQNQQDKIRAVAD